MFLGKLWVLQGVLLPEFESRLGRVSRSDGFLFKERTNPDPKNLIFIYRDEQDKQDGEKPKQADLKLVG